MKLNLACRSLPALLLVFVVAGVGDAEVRSSAAKFAGTWKIAATAADGKTYHPILKLKDEAPLVGTYVTDDGQEVKVADLKIDGAEISFNVTHDFGAQTIKLAFRGTLAGDSLAGEVRFELGGGAGTIKFDARREANQAKDRVEGRRSPAIPSDAASFQGHAYKFFAEHLTWKDAKAKCALLGGHLVIVDSADENKFVADLVDKAGSQDAWIGITDEAEEGKWRTVAGKPVSYTNWFPGQPNNKGGVEHYALMSSRTFGKPLGWTWCDQPNESKEHQPGYVCEWDAVTKAVAKSGATSRPGTPPSSSASDPNATPSRKSAGSSYVIVWDFDATKALKASTGEILIPAPVEQSYFKARWELDGVVSQRIIDIQDGRLIAVRPAGPRFVLRVSVEPTAQEIAKRKEAAPVPADAAASLRDNVSAAARNPRTARLAHELKAGDATETVQKIRRWMADNMRSLDYTNPTLILKPFMPVGGIDSILEAKRANCTGRSNLFVALCRQAGIPARVVWGPVKVGGKVPAPTKTGQPLIDVATLGDFSGHFWAVVYLEPWGWVPLEPQEYQTPLGTVPTRSNYANVPFLRLASGFDLASSFDSEAGIAISNVGRMNWFARLEKSSNRDSLPVKAK